MEIPLFLLDTVLFPGGRLPLRVFETRYMDMVKESLRANAPFGICAPAQSVGTLAHIADWDMPQLGILSLVTHGGQRFRILSQRTLKSGLVRAEVDLLAEPPVTPIPGDYARLVPMLRALLEALADGMPPEPHRFYDAAWLACRWAELLPLPLAARQQILELDEGVARLEAIYRFLEQESSRPG